ncbi:unnamed protein product, partial [Hapterophycus canaliculatus]
AKTNKGRGSTKEASSFTLARFELWPATLRAWLTNVEIHEAA